MLKRYTLFISILLSVLFLAGQTSYAFWIWTPKEKTIINPKYVVKDTPKEQYDWAMNFFNQSDFKRSAEEFVRLVKYYPDSEYAPEAQYYAGRSFEELAKYYFAYQNYQKTIDNYPYTKRLEEINEREFKIAKIFQEKEGPKFMEMELSLALDRAVTIYGKVVENSPFGVYADKSLFNMGECYRRMHKYDDAVDSYERIISDYPDSKIIPEVKYQLAYTRYEAALNPEYDQESTEKALKEFQEIAGTTSVPAVAAEAERTLNKLRARKADSMVKIAEFYERRGKYSSAIIYYRDVVAKFRGTEPAQKAEEKIEELKKKIEKEK